MTALNKHWSSILVKSLTEKFCDWRKAALMQVAIGACLPKLKRWWFGASRINVENGTRKRFGNAEGYSYRVDQGCKPQSKQDDQFDKFAIFVSFLLSLLSRSVDWSLSAAPFCSGQFFPPPPPLLTDAPNGEAQPMCSGALSYEFVNYNGRTLQEQTKCSLYTLLIHRCAGLL